MVSKNLTVGGPFGEADGYVAPRYDKSHPEGFVDKRYSDLKNGVESKRSRESRRDADGEYQPIFLADHVKQTQHKPGWDGGVYTPPPQPKLETSGATIKEF